MKKQEKMVRLIRKHSNNCAAMRECKSGNWNTPWCGIPEETQWLTRFGTKTKGHVPWLLIICNDTKCRARKIVRCDAVAMIEPQPDSLRCPHGATLY